MAELSFSCKSTSATGGVITLNTLDGVVVISGAGSVDVTTAGQTIVVSGSAAGGGGSVALRWRFKNDTSAGDPSSGNFRLNNATPASVTAIYVSSTTRNGVDAQNILGAITADDRIYIQNIDDADEFILITVVSTVDNTGWFTINVTVDSGGSTFTNNKDAAWIIVFGEVADHGQLSGLLDDDHPQHPLVDGTRGFLGTVSGVDPVDADDLATKNYVDITVIPNESDIDSINTVTGSLTLGDAGTITIIDETTDSDNPIITVSGLPDESDVDGIKIGVGDTVSGTVNLVGKGNITLLNKTVDPDNPIVVISGVSPVPSGIQPHIFNFTVGAPLTGDNAVGEFFTNAEVEIVEMKAMIRGGTSPSVDWTIRHGDDRNATGTEVVVGGTVSTNTTTGDSVTSFNNPTVTGGSWLWLELGTVSAGVNAPETFTVTVIEEFGV